MKYLLFLPALIIIYLSICSYAATEANKMREELIKKGTPETDWPDTAFFTFGQWHMQALYFAIIMIIATIILI